MGPGALGGRGQEVGSPHPSGGALPFPLFFEFRSFQASTCAVAPSPRGACAVGKATRVFLAGVYSCRVPELELREVLV